MARCGFVLSLASLVHCSLPLVLLCASLGLTQSVSAQNPTDSAQPTEPTSGEVSLNDLDAHINFSIVNKLEVGIPFSLGLSFDNNNWTPALFFLCFSEACNRRCVPEGGNLAVIKC